MKEPSEFFRENLGAYMLETKTSKTALSKKTGISRSLLDKYLGGESIPKLNHLGKICSALEKSYEEMLCHRGTAVMAPSSPITASGQQVLLKLDHPLSECVRRVSAAALENRTAKSAENAQATNVKDERLFQSVIDAWNGFDDMERSALADYANSVLNAKPSDKMPQSNGNPKKTGA